MNPIPITLTMQGIPAKEERFCSDCTHLLGNRSYKDSWKTWRCDKTKEIEGKNLVNGEILFSASFCDSVRKNPECCGLEGSWYEEYIPSQFLDVSEADKPRKGKLTATDLDNL